MVPAGVLQPGLELVVGIDPEDTPGLGRRIARRIPETGRRAIDVRAVPHLHLAYLPVIRPARNSREFLDRVLELTEDDDLFGPARQWLPVAGFTVDVRPIVYSSARTSSELIREIEAIRVLEGGTEYYMGGLPSYLAEEFDVGGQAYIGDARRDKRFAHGPP